MSTQIRWASDVILHDNHVPPVTLTQRDLPGKVCNTILLSNTTAATTVYISFDGVNEFSILPGGVFTLNFSNGRKYWTRGDGVNGVEVIAGAEGVWE
jgi:hypothetical protein